MTNDRRGVQGGMTVYSQDGEKLGTVQVCEDRSFVIEKGFFFPKDYVAMYSDVAEIRDGAVWLARGRESLTEGNTLTEATSATSTTAIAPGRGAGLGDTFAASPEEMRMGDDRSITSRADAVTGGGQGPASEGPAYRGGAAR